MNRKGRIFRPFLYLLSVFFCSTLIAQDETRLGVEFSSFNYSEATSLHSIAGRWSEAIGKGNEAWSQSRFVLDYNMQPLQLQALYRDDIYYRFANETAQLLYLAENRLPLPSGQAYPLLIEADRITSKGLGLGYSVRPLQGLMLGAKLSLLQPIKILQGGLQGSAAALADNDYDFAFSSDLVYHHDPLYGRQTDAISGDGYAIDLKLDYQINRQWFLQLEFLDVAGEISIDDAPFTEADASSEVKSFDDEGYLTYNPVISGVEGFKNVRHRLDMQSQLSLSYQLENRDKLVFEHHDRQQLTYQRLVYQQSINEHKISWQVIPALQALGIGYSQRYFSVGLEADKLNYKKMKLFSLHSQLFVRF